ncbi:hypothetical protein H4Q26_009915 [Puccinia striiformis f. sp. tritici PST-130]|nr:hypothetical protein H4Q26_009915 [Puccinia striiformis f. sp. tritici PST-130]
MDLVLCSGINTAMFFTPKVDPSRRRPYLFTHMKNDRWDPSVYVDETITSSTKSKTKSTPPPGSGKTKQGDRRAPDIVETFGCKPKSNLLQKPGKEKFVQKAKIKFVGK